ncbi:4-hydroxythreonine-4-phosphate dehydrogenase PdxA [Ideonella sp. TBM-1]|uniref:4-hydroxythreonine-4-phosphate dehydrogenase PdxA n=2 Tax=Ideonella livida TaxID=2707176 RepID=A0A7C9PFD9_9BURK|nr:4-hydroxythreonine-4-phosphate dehydrogenase PdxA [Ideonella livida]
MGDPVGIGPEILVKAFIRGGLAGGVVIGDVQVMRRAAALCAERPPLAVLDRVEDACQVPDGTLAIWQPEGLPTGLAQLPWGAVHAQAGAAAVSCIEAAAALLNQRRASGLVTAPIHKEAIHAAGVNFPGHTELLQHLATGSDGQVPPVRMMLANEALRVVLVTIHVGLRQAIDMLDFDLVVSTLRITLQAMRRFGLTRPRIAVAGLNPHAGEGGLFGREEIDIIRPAVELLQAEGEAVSGPYAPDTVFMRARHMPPHHPGEFDAVVAMTHDHGLIPVKYLGVEEGVNVTLGLPWVRTSPDHGTAFDLAGTGRADPSSLEAAVRMARRLVRGVQAA